MKIMGLQKTTLLDYPGHVAATIFLKGCNMRCPFCHNMNIVEASDLEPSYTIEEIFDFLSKRIGILDGVCITGGEPTINPELPDFIRRIKGLGFLVKLDTNGTNPQMLRKLIDEGILDYVAMDIKTGLSEYGRVCGILGIDTGKISESVKLLNNSNTDHEFRTTLMRQYHTETVMEEIGKLLEGSDKYFLQSFKDSDFVPDHSLSPLTKEELLEYKAVLQKYINNVEIRGVDL